MKVLIYYQGYLKYLKIRYLMSIMINFKYKITKEVGEIFQPHGKISPDVTVTKKPIQMTQTPKLLNIQL